MSDRRADFLKQGMSALEASEAVAALMGDPVEVGRTMSKLHNPLLGWIWFLFRGLAVVLLTVMVCLVVFGIYDVNRLLPQEECSGSCKRLSYAEEFVGEDRELVWLNTRPTVQVGQYRLSVDHGFWMKNEQMQAISVAFQIDYQSVFDLPPSGIAERLQVEDDLGNRIDPESVGVDLLFHPDTKRVREEQFHIYIRLEDGISRQWLRLYIPGTEFDLTVCADGKVIV